MAAATEHSSSPKGGSAPADHPRGDATVHAPVMVARITALLATDRPGVLVDATLGAGGHAVALLEASHPETVLVGFDRDADALAVARRRLAPFGDRAVLVHDAYDTLDVHLAGDGFGPVLGVLYDLGVSSLQLDTAGRGFSFRAPAPLDMRMDPRQETTAADLVNTLSEGELAAVLRGYGEERSAGRIARAIVAARPLHTTTQLAELVAGAVPARVRFGPVHPATRTFQALRIATNGELDRLRASLPQALGLAAPAADTVRGGRIAVLSYHSLEDRIAKAAFADAATGCICPPELPVCGCGRVPLVRSLTRGADTPDPDEVAANPRARSARFRAVERTAAYPRERRTGAANGR